MQETTAGGVLVKAVNGHITRGGEFEKRAAFTPEYELPEGTVGLATAGSELYVFGTASSAPAGLPAGLSYQQLEHPDGTPSLTEVLSYTVYAGKLYVVAKYDNGDVLHFYDGALVDDWYDGRARAVFQLTGGNAGVPTAATGSFTITGGTTGSGSGINGVSALTVNGVAIISGFVDHTGNNSTTATAVAAAINSYTSSPDYTASAVGPIVNIAAVTTGTGPNGYVVTPTAAGTASVGSVNNMAGGTVGDPSQVTDIKVDGVSIIDTAVSWAGTLEDTAAAIAAEINSYTSSPEYEAFSSGTSVTVAADVSGVAANGKAVTMTLADGLTVSPSSGLTMANGADGSTFTPGGFVRTVGKKVYATSGTVLHFSGVAAPTQWTTDSVGAGFIDMSSEASGIEELSALSQYQDKLAVYSPRAIIIEYVDPDPSLNRQSQVLNNTGTLSPNSVTQFGDNDQFYLDESGIRSLRARQSTDSAATTDIGVPIDSIVVEKLSGLTSDERKKVFGVIEPRDGRFWMIVKDVIYVFSFFNGAKVSAWSTYTPSIVVDGDEELFTVDDVAVYERRVHIRSGNIIYVYGSSNTTLTYDATVAEAWLPYLDAETPTKRKSWTGVDAALEGNWATYVGLDPTNVDAEDKIGVLSKTTYNLDRVPAIGESTHISPRFRTTGSGYARLSSVVMHYEGSADED